jgi:hypothetical protein
MTAGDISSGRCAAPTARARHFLSRSCQRLVAIGTIRSPLAFDQYRGMRPARPGMAPGPRIVEEKFDGKDEECVRPRNVTIVKSITVNGTPGAGYGSMTAGARGQRG